MPALPALPRPPLPSHLLPCSLRQRIGERHATLRLPHFTVPPRHVVRNSGSPCTGLPSVKYATGS